MAGVELGTAAVVAEGVALGLGAAVPIGPVNVQIARQALRSGFKPAFSLGCGAVTVDVVYAVMAGVGLERVARSGAVEWLLRVGGVGLLTYLGVMCLRSEREAWRFDPIARNDTIAAPRPSAAGAYATGLFMTLLNPMTLAFWLIAVPALAGPVGGGERRHLPLICSGVFAGTITWVVVFAGVLAFAGKYRREWWLPLADAAGGAALLVFAAVALLSSLRAFL